eukprot:6206893-Pleurochrysis_carterae.AAC.2
MLAGARDPCLLVRATHARWCARPMLAGARVRLQMCTRRHLREARWRELRFQSVYVVKESVGDGGTSLARERAVTRFGDNGHYDRRAARAHRAACERHAARCSLS